MNRVLLHTKAGCVTARAIAKALGVRAGRRLRAGEMPLPFRWGNERTSKLHDLSLMADNDISVPAYLSRKECYLIDPSQDREERMWFMRKSQHTRGMDILLLMGTAKQAYDLILAGRYSHATLHIPARREYRVHLFAGKVVLLQKKYFRDQLYERLFEESDNPEKLAEEYEYIRNNEHGWGFYDIKHAENVPKPVVDEATKAARLLNPNGPAAIDVIWGEDRKAYVLEVNTAPGLRSRNIQAYVNAITVLL